VATFFGLALSARDLAKVGLVLLRGGRYEGRDIVPSAWIDEATHPAREGAPAGYLWWVQSGGFGADGWLGQYLVVYPKVGLVGVRQHREPEGGADETENEAFGFKEFPALVRELAIRRFTVHRNELDEAGGWRPPRTNRRAGKEAPCWRWF
jgi:CubicO group peptidase (beta-lactamase class C family)